MAVRRESVELSLTGNFTAEVTQAAGAVALLHAQVNALNGQNIRISTNVNNQMASMSRQANATGGSINQLTGRLGAFADAALILGPGLIPIAAAGGVAIMGLVNAAGALATVGASAVAAFQGLGDAVKAVDEYQLEPTAANLEKAEEAMGKLAPAAREFVMAFQDFQPVLTGIRDAAAEGWFPGLTESLDDFEKIAPLVERIFRRSGMAGGDITADVADSLDSKRWKPFMRFIGEEAPHAMYSLATIMGDLSHGVAEMWMSFDPGNDAFLGWLEDVADGFDKWASSAEGQDSIEGFLAYARENGPAVQELFTSLVGALSSIVQAAAPLGGPVLSALTAVADVIKIIADSDMGTPIMAAVIAWRAYARMAPLIAAAQAKMTASTTATTQALMTQRQLQSYNTLPAHLQAAFARQRASDAAAQRAQQRSMMMRGGAMAVGGAFLVSGAADSMDATNTAMLALMGTMLGPWGAAAGAAAGAALDVAAANNELTESLESAGAAIDSGDFAAMSAGLEDASAKLAEFKANRSETGAFENPMSVMADWKNNIEGMLGDSDVEEGEQALAALEARAMSTQEAAAGLGRALGMTVGPLDGSARSARELEAAVAAAQPHLDKLGITMDDIKAAQARSDGTGPGGVLGAGFAALEEIGAIDSIEDYNKKVRESQIHSESAAGQTENLAAAFASLSNEMMPASERAGMLSTALDALIDPAMSAEAATDAWHSSLQNLRKELNDGAGFEGYRKGAIENRALTREYVDGVKQRLVAMVEAGAGEKQMMAAVRESRAEFIKSGEAAGISGKEIRKRANEMGLTPDLVRTVFEAVGLVESTIKAERVRAIYNSLPENVQTRIAVEGVPKSRAEARALANDMDLAAEDRKAVIELGDLASGPAKGTKKNLDEAAKDRRPTISLNDQASGKARSIMQLLNGMNGQTATTYVKTVHYSVQGGGYARGDQDPSAGADGGTWNGRRFAAAGGGTVPGKRTPYGDKIYAYLAPGEEVISNRYGQADRHRELLKQINANRMADGGTAGRQPPGGQNWSGGVTLDTIATTLDTLADSADGAAGGLRGLRARLRESERALQAEQSQRSAAVSLKSQVAGSLAGDLFGNGLAGFDVGVAANGNDAKAMLLALAKAKKKGLDGPLLNLLAASGDLNTVQQFAELSRAEIAKREQQYGSTVRAENQLGDYAVQQKFGQSIDSMSKEIQRLNQTIRTLDKKIEKAAEKGTEKGSRKGSDDRNRGTLQRSRLAR